MLVYLIIHCIFVLTIVQLLHNSLHTAQAWFHDWIWGGLLHQVHTYSVWSPYVWYISGAEAVLTVLSHKSPLLIHGRLPHLSISFISNLSIVTENTFSALWFLYSTVIQSFIDVFKSNKYKKHIIQCFLLLHLLLEVAQASGKTFKLLFYIITNILNKNLHWQNQSALLPFLLHLVIYYK